ncbi:NAD-dependent epimerase/dehydratase family protein [Streptomyces reniochalinae]|nr:hypothetical protein [Streptomyces reniochalinae]
MALRASAGLPLELNGGGHQVRHLVPVDDIASGTIRALAAARPTGPVLNIGTGRPTTIRDVAKRIRLHYPAVQLVERALPTGDPLGAPQVSVEEGIDRYVKWLGERPEATPPWLSELAA